jgi:dehydrogenase/reductase SDR family member 12
MTTRAVLAEGADLALEATIVLSFSRVGFDARRRLWSWPVRVGHPMAGRVVVVTGANSGLGLSATEQFAALGASVVMVGRDEAGLEAARAQVVASTGNEQVSTMRCDLARLDDVHGLADRLLAERDRLDVIVHNAGALVHDFERTVDGLEVTIQTQVVSPFVLTSRLLDLLASTAAARVITVASGGMYTQRLTDLDLGPDGFDGVRAYALAKRAQVVLNEQWARRVNPRAVSFHAMHPGWVDTPGLRRSLPRFYEVMGRWLRSPEQGSDTVIWLATDPGAGCSSGSFWLDRHRRWTSKVPWTVTTQADAERLWDWVSRNGGTTGVVPDATSAGGRAT